MNLNLNPHPLIGPSHSAALFARLDEIGMRGYQQGRALEILRSGKILLTWQRADGLHRFCGLTDRPSKKPAPAG
jgi:hypothetical protein